MQLRNRTYWVTVTQPCTRCEGSGFIIGEGAGQCPHCVDGIETVETDIINALDHYRVFTKLHALEVEAQALRLLIQGLSNLLAMTDYNNIARRLAAIETSLEPSGLLHIERRLENIEATLTEACAKLGIKDLT